MSGAGVRRKERHCRNSGWLTVHTDDRQIFSFREDLLNASPDPNRTDASKSRANWRRIEESRKESDKGDRVLELRSRPVWRASVRGSGTAASIPSRQLLCYCHQKAVWTDVLHGAVARWSSNSTCISWRMFSVIANHRCTMGRSEQSNERRIERNGRVSRLMAVHFTV